jgi:hypothetical protein
MSIDKLPLDIQTRIHKLFPNESDQRKACELLLGLWEEKLNVGPAQLARATLVLCEGSIQAIVSLRKSYIYGDPRDVIMKAEGKIGNPEDYFNSPLSN